MSRKAALAAGRVVAIYLALGFAWILLSDRVLASLVADPGRIATIQTLKGWAFVLVSAAVLFYFVKREVLQRAKHEQTLRARDAAAAEVVRRSEERLSKIVRLAPLGITISTLDDGRFLEANQAFLDLFGLEREDVIGRRALDLGFWVDPEARQRMVERIRATGEARSLEATHRTKGGRLLDVQVSAATLDLDEGACLLAVTQDVSDRKRFERQLERQALYDPQSGLPNRTLVSDRLAQAVRRARRRGSRVAILYIDLDEFQRVNDTLGHAAGDRLLADVARRLRRCVRTQDTVGHLGGDEFAVILEDIPDDGEARIAAERVTEALRRPFRLGGVQVHVTASIGIAAVPLLNVAEPEDLLRYGGVAMFRAKTGPDGYHVFDPVADAVETDRLHRENELREALERRELRLAYQGIFSLRDRRLVGAEALVRWEHPERGTLHPGEFIPLAESTGLIVPLGRQVMEAAVRRVEEWGADPGLPEGFLLSVNLSAVEFQEPDLVNWLSELLARHRLPPGRLLLEITESAVVRGPSRLEELRRLGVRLAVDDFGTGYSSLSYLKRLAVDALKIDHSFVRGLGKEPEDLAIVQSVVLLAEHLDLACVAEGIETEEQLAHLRDLGCELGQGFHLARPAPAEAFRELLPAGAGTMAGAVAALSPRGT